MEVLRRWREVRGEEVQCSLRFPSTDMSPSLVPVVLITYLLLPLLPLSTADATAATSAIHRRPPAPRGSLCSQLVQPAGYPCSEYTVQTKDGYLLALHRVSSSGQNLRAQRGRPVLLQHGLFMGGDAWFLNSADQSLGFILADHGFDVWIGNVRGTRWSYGHISLSERDKDFWDWSWQELALCDLAEMVHFINSTTGSKVFLVGHSQGTIMSLAALTQPDIAEMVEAAALLSPISYLGHITAPLVWRMVNMHVDQMIIAMGIHQLNFRSDFDVGIMDAICDGRIECNDLLTSITGKNCCFNNSRVDFYLEYEPHPSSSKNLRHLFQMIRKGSFSMYDYGVLKNLKVYGQFKPPMFDLTRIPKTMPLWMAYGGNDALSDITDVKQTLSELHCKTELVYLENYGHVDFILGLNAKEEIYDHMIGFFRSFGKSYSS
ncbi:triacylglycerol lipase 1 isoform X2 [Punica granatum]|uniref:Lipase n=2 Tax=Punica granatum TaxID=22663 RepID=A0A6P8CR01_PUNGR|nr:triacylglycerol lipase 1 isoform X2 [Punica granatum]